MVNNDVLQGLSLEQAGHSTVSPAPAWYLTDHEASNKVHTNSEFGPNFLANKYRAFYHIFSNYYEIYPCKPGVTIWLHDAAAQ